MRRVQLVAREINYSEFVAGDRLTKIALNRLGDSEVTANIYCKSRNLPNTDTQNYSTDLR